MEFVKTSEFNWLNKFGIIKLDETTKKYINQDIKKNFWVPNNVSTNCFDCEVKFSTFIVRQHHCRICGNIFCNDCSSKQIQVLIKNKILKLRICNKCLDICQKFSIYIENKFIKEEMKEYYYCNNYEKSIINNKKFLKFENERNEKEIKENINNIFELILKNLIKNILKEYFSKEICEEWENILFSLIKEVNNNLRTNSLLLSDSLNINKFIKIKLIPYKDSSKCKVIPGFVMKKKCFSQNLKTSFIGPKILLINLEKDIIIKKLDNLSILPQRSNAYIQIIEKKIQISNPDIILIGQNFPKLLFNDFQKNSLINEKCFIFDVKKKSLENIARCTQNIILPSLDLLGTNNIFGKCKHFYMKNIEYKFKFQNEIDNKSFTKKEKETNKNENYLMIFEGANQLLFNTIILSGEDKLFLKKLKNLLKNILLPTARDLFLQKDLLYTFNMKINNKENFNEKEIYKIFEENKNNWPKELNQEPMTLKDFDLKKSININNQKKEIKLRKTYEIVNRLLNKGNKLDKRSNKIITNYNNLGNSSNLFYKGFDLSIICRKCEYINYSLIRISKTTNNQNYNQIIEENNLEMFDEDEINYSLVNKRATITTFSHPIIEKKVQKNMGKYCKQPTKIFLSFFCDNKSYDKPLGKFIFDLCKESQTNCSVCGMLLSKHIHHLYKSDGRVNIKLISDKDNFLDKIINYLEINDNFKFSNKIPEYDNNLAIYTYGYCNICQEITTPLFKLSNEILNYSFSKFFRFLLENINIENYNREYDYNIKNMTFHKSCKHFINKDISRIFITKYGSWLFEYNNISKYFIYPLDINLKINDIDKNNKNSNNSNDLIEEYINEANNNSKIILDMLYNLFQKQISGLQILLNDEKLYLFKTIINKLINIIVMVMTLIEEFKSKIISNYLSKEYRVSNININLLKYIVIIKKIYLKIIQIKIIANSIDKYIIELNVISGILNGKLPYTYEENLKLIEGKNEDIPIELQLFDIKVDKTPTININFENNSIYLKILSFIEYYDNRHNNYSCEFINHDLSCAISLALSSDDYLNFIKKENKNNIQFSNIKCKRKTNEFNYFNIKKHISTEKNNVMYLNIYERKERKDLIEGEIKENIRQNKTFFDNSLIFDLSNNNFYNNNKEENEKDILEFLKEELISNNKEEFNYTLSNNYQNVFDKMINKNFKNSFKELKKENNEKNINDIMEINGINQEINNIKINLSEFSSSFIEQQRELNTIIKSLLQPKTRKNSSCHSSKRLHEIREDSFKKPNRKDSNSSKNSSEDEYEPKSFDGNNLINILNENNSNNNNIQPNVIPSFPFIPEFLKIFELKEPKYYEEEILEKKYPEFKIKIYYPNQFQALRTIFCATNEEFIESIRKSIEWSVTGGKSNANFYKTHDNKYVIKNISEMEFNMFIESALNYFKHISKYLFNKKSSAMGKILGAYHVKIKMQGEKDKNYYLIYMENIYYGMLTNINNFTFNTSESNIMVYDLKGSKINRYVQKKNKKPGKVLLDTNFLEDFNGEPLFLDFNVFQSLQDAIKNDSQFLKDEGVIDYSLLIIFENDKNNGGCNNNKNEIIDEKNNFKLIRLGIIDYLRKYTWDKQIESYSKKFLNGFSNPTIINPDSYSKRFMEKFQRYFVGI